MVGDSQDPNSSSLIVYHEPSNNPEAFQAGPPAYVAQDADPPTGSDPQAPGLRPNPTGHWPRGSPTAATCNCCASSNCCRCCGCVRAPPFTRPGADRIQQSYHNTQPCCLFHQVQTPPPYRKPTRVREPGRRPYSSQPPSPCVFLPIQRRRLHRRPPENRPQRFPLFGIPFLLGRSHPAKVKYVYAVNGKTELRSLNPRDGQFLNRPVTVSFTPTLSSSASPRDTRSTSRTSTTSFTSASAPSSGETLVTDSDTSQAEQRPIQIQSSGFGDTNNSSPHQRHPLSHLHRLRNHNSPRCDPREAAMRPPYLPAANVVTRRPEHAYYPRGLAPRKPDVYSSPPYEASWRAYPHPHGRYAYDTQPPAYSAPQVEQAPGETAPLPYHQESASLEGGPRASGASAFTASPDDNERISSNPPEVRQSPRPRGAKKPQSDGLPQTVSRDAELQQPQSLSEMFHRLSPQPRPGAQSPQTGSPGLQKNVSSKSGASLALSSLESSLSGVSPPSGSFEKKSSRTKLLPSSAMQRASRARDDLRAHRRKLDDTPGHRSAPLRPGAGVRADAQTLRSVIGRSPNGASTATLAEPAVAAAAPPTSGSPQEELPLNEANPLDPLIAAVNANTSALARFLQSQQAAQRHPIDAHGDTQKALLTDCSAPPLTQQWRQDASTGCWPHAAQLRPPGAPRTQQPAPFSWEPRCHPGAAHAAQTPVCYAATPCGTRPVPRATPLGQPSVPVRASWGPASYAPPSSCAPSSCAASPAFTRLDGWTSRPVQREGARPAPVPVPGFKADAVPPCFRGLRARGSPRRAGKPLLQDARATQPRGAGAQHPAPGPETPAHRQTSACGGRRLSKQKTRRPKGAVRTRDLSHDARNLLRALDGRYRYDSSQTVVPTVTGQSYAVTAGPNMRPKSARPRGPASCGTSSAARGSRHREAGWPPRCGKPDLRDRQQSRRRERRAAGVEIHGRPEPFPKPCFLGSDCCKPWKGRERGRSKRA